MPETNGSKARDIQDFYEVASSLRKVKRALACASVALEKAHNTLDDELASHAWLEIEDWVADLGRVETDLDAWHAAHKHTPSAAVCDFA